MKHIQMPKIPQFRNVIKTVTNLCRWEGEDEDGNPIYNDDILPTLTAHGSVKLHGTCASVCYNTFNGLWTQSKNQIITPIKDNAGFSFFATKQQDFLFYLMMRVKNIHSVNTIKNTISIFGEWAGKGIQAGVAITQLERKFFIFGIKISPHDEEKAAYWVTSDIFGEFEPEGDIFHIKNFKTFEVDIDFSDTKIAEEEFEKIVNAVEAECPVAKRFGVSGIGEGVVFTLNYKGNRLMFKIKGKKHKGGGKVKQRKSKTVNQEIINYVVHRVTHMRLEQMVNESFDVLNGGEICIEGMGNYLRAVRQDIIDEDLDIIIDAGLTMKQIGKTLHSVARDYLLEKLGMLITQISISKV